MKLKNNVALAIATALIAGTSSLAYAHGDAGHASKPTALNMEQQDWGIAGDPKKVTMTITEDMLDTMRFSKDNLQVKQGDTVRFVLKNGGKVMHEFVIGTKKTLDEHAALMGKLPGRQHDQP